jgi:hypothetical protein
VTDHLKLIATALRVTLNAPLLWFFGLFLSAGFNFNWFYLTRAGFPSAGTYWVNHFWQSGQSHPQLLAPAILPLLLFLVLGWIGVNWIKTVFILNVSDLLETKRLGQTHEELTIWQKQGKLFGQAKKVLVSVAALSLFTIVAQAVVTFVLLSPWLWQKYIAPVPGMVVLATTLFIAFMLFFSLLNFFAVLFVVLYQQKFQEAFGSATHFMRVHAKPLFVACVLLLALYAGGVFIGSEILANINFVFFLWLGFLNAFFNVALFLFFKAYIKPRQFEAEDPAVTKLILKVSVDKTL